jgi:hypothetical protein
MSPQNRSRLVLALVLSVGFLALASWQVPAGAQEEERPKGRPLTEHRLLDFLEGLGYEPQESKAPNGPLVCKIKMQVDAWTFYPTVELSPDKSICWVVIGLQRLPDPQRVPREILIKLLQENETGLKFFSLDKKTHLIKLNLPLPNYEISPSFFRQQLEFMVQMIRRTEDLWNPKKWEKEEGLSDRD